MRWFAGCRRIIVALGVLPALAGCYTYIPVATLEPARGTKLSLVLNDEGRTQTARQVGPYTMRVEGELLRATPDDLVLAVTDVVDIRGARSKWTGETVPLSRSYVMTTYERRLSRSKTILVVTAVTAGLAAFIASRNLLGFGGHSDSGGGGPPDPNGQ
jgi:hypothetical protein